MTDLAKLTLTDAREGLRKKQFSVGRADAGVSCGYRGRQQALERLRVADAEIALRQAKDSDARLAKGEARPLEGVPLGIKDLYCTKGVRTTACSRSSVSSRPPTSTVTQNLWDAGAVMLGKLNYDEFAMGSSNETSCFGPVTNPWRRKGSNVALVPGGSSGGSSSAVAADLCLGRDGHRHGRLDPPAGGHHRHGRHQAHLRALLALGHGRVCVLARPGGADRQDRAGRGHHAAPHGEHRSQGLRPASMCPCPTTRPRSARA